MNNFKLSEFDSPDLKGSGENMDIDFLQKIDKARDLYGHPIKINSGYRTPGHNKAVGGVRQSSHLLGVAADIHCNTSTGRMELVKALVDAGFTRIGIAKYFIHVDTDPNKPKALWLYK